jgi:hypothetical protein
MKEPISTVPSHIQNAVMGVLSRCGEVRGRMRSDQACEASAPRLRVWSKTGKPSSITSFALVHERICVVP